MSTVNWRAATIVLALFLLPGCGVPATPIPGLQIAELKYRLIDQLAAGNSRSLVFCDPYSVPVTNPMGEQQDALTMFSAFQQDQGAFQAILDHLNLVATANFTPDMKLSIYREYRVLKIINLLPAAGGYQFGFTFYDKNSFTGVSDIGGIISADGKISVQRNIVGSPRMCPICLVAGTLIDTPSGQVAVKDLQVGMSVWTVDKGGNRQAALIIKTAHVSVPFGHTVVHLRLSDGRELWASPPHPTADGRLLGSLQLGDSVDGATVTGVERVQYPDDSTYDILPAGDTGVYWANGILMKSTLTETAQF